MSVLRISAPGKPTQFVILDDGASPRIDAARSTSSRFTPLTDVRPPFSGMTGVEIRPSSIAGAHKRKAMTVVPRCGHPVMGLGRKPTGEACYRRPGHGEGCRSKAAVERDNARRRAREYGPWREEHGPGALRR